MSHLETHKKIVILILFLIPILGNFNSDADTIYSFIDENGIKRFSDIPPETEQKVSKEFVRSGDSVFEVDLRVLGNTVFASHRYFGPVSIQFSYVYRKLSKSFVITQGTEIATVLLSEKKIESVLAVPGDYRATHNPVKPYRPPFSSGERYMVSQSFNGRFSHTDLQNRYAVDIAMPIGSPICAIRSGYVMDMAGDFIVGGATKENIRRANYIRILHDDGTMAVYAHLKFDSALSQGEYVKEGHVIALSGNTGFSTGPHLHLAIQINKNMELISIPFYFEGDHGRGIIPKENMVLSVPLFKVTDE